MVLDFSQGALTLVVEVDEKGRAFLKECCYGASGEKRVKKATHAPLAEVHITGENADDHHGMKHTGSYGSYALRYVSHSVSQTDTGKRIAILLSDARMNVTVFYQLHTAANAIRSWTVVENIGDDPLGLEYVSSSAFTGLDDGIEHPDDRAVSVGIPHSGTVRENNWQFYTLGDLGLNRISAESTKRFTLSNTGTWSCKEQLPMAVLENRASGHCWLWQIEHHGSWHWELSERSKMLYLRVSGPTEQENHWYRCLARGERFESVRVAVILAPDTDAAFASLSTYRRQIFQNNAANQEMPVIFNDYMNCLWADPTEEKEYPLIDAAAAAGAEYYCIDAGWYADGRWWETVGEWLPCAWRFPQGIEKLFDYIRCKGMIPGIWLEIEVMGINCPLAKEWEDACFFMRHGKRVIDHGRYQLDFRHPRVRAHASAVVDRVIREYGVGYIKMDYNIEAGIGTEVDAHSFGDGLLQHNRAYLDWLDGILQKYPDLIWENCSSGGMRMDYGMLQRAHMQSVTDQTCYRTMVRIAAAAPAAVLPEQSAIWSYPLADADADAVNVNMINAMLQRIHLSGKLTSLSPAAWEQVCAGVAVYQSYRKHLIGARPFWPLGLPAAQHGFEALGMRCDDRTLLAVWRLDSKDAQIGVPVCGQAKILYPVDAGASVCTTADGLCVTLPRPFTAVLLEIKE